MHEMALTQGVLGILEEQATAQNFTRVKTVVLEIGGLSHVDPDAMRFCFEAVMKNTLADGASLDIQRPEGKGWCMDCSDTVVMAARTDPCPTCGGYKMQVIEGDDMRIKELEVE